MTSNLITLPSSLGQRVLYPATAVTSEFRHSTAGALTALPRAVSSKTTSFDETFFYTGTTNSPAVSIFAPLIQINWGPQDAQAISRKLFPASTSSTSDPAQNRSNLPTAAKITIGVVVPIVGLIVFIVAITLLLRLRHRKQQRAGQGKKFEKSELEATNPASGTQKIAPIRELSAAGGLQELGPQQYHEMHVPNVHHELIVPHVVHEIGHSDRAHGTSQV
ncbi:MAG: hypothetical protein M1820_007656 [Bogoriella megaspora]|nr:MAG: hypothetical protein M1820_007656 [Bogoriella megaspora]